MAVSLSGPPPSLRRCDSVHLWLLSSSSHSSFSAAEQMIETLRPGSSGSSGRWGGDGGSGGVVQVRLSGSGILGGVAASARHAIIGDAQIHPQYDPNVDEVASRLLLSPASTPRPRLSVSPCRCSCPSSLPTRCDAAGGVEAAGGEGGDVRRAVARPLRPRHRPAAGASTPPLPSPPLPSLPRRRRVLPWHTTARLRLPGWPADVRWCITVGAACSSLP